jgi:DNA-binding CsgD family transcriptional regulator
MKKALLTLRESQVLRIIALKGTKPAPEELSITRSTLKMHLHTIYKKLQVTTLLEAILKASDLNLINRPIKIIPDVVICREIQYDGSPTSIQKIIEIVGNAEVERGRVGECYLPNEECLYIGDSIVSDGKCWWIKHPYKIKA